MAEQTYGVLDNVVLCYAKLDVPTKKYESEDLVYEVDCVVDKPVAKVWNKQFTKQKAKEFDKEDFESKYKIDAPFGGDEVYIIKMRKPATKDGVVFEEKFRPKVLLDMADGERVDITTSRKISNGSKAKVSYRITENKFGTFGLLNNVLMDEDGFIEYTSNGGSAGTEFDGKSASKVEPTSAAVAGAKKAKIEKDLNEPEPPEEKRAAAKPVKPNKPKAPVDDDGDSDAPF